MRKLVFALLVGVGLGIVGTLAVQRWNRTADSPVHHQALLISVAPHLLERALPGAKALDVSTTSPSTSTVNYEHDELYDVHITYQRSNEIREMVVPFGFARGTPIVPSTTDFVIANDNAKIVRRLTSPDGRQ
jgi:hypothetical protein